MNLHNQRLWAVEQFKRTGTASRNHALRNRISRLGAIRKVLEDLGWHIEGARVGTDYVYFLIHKPGMAHSISWSGVTFQGREYVCLGCPPVGRSATIPVWQAPPDQTPSEGSDPSGKSPSPSPTSKSFEPPTDSTSSSGGTRYQPGASLSR